MSEEEPRSPESKVMPIDKVKEQLDILIIQNNFENEDVFDWIEVRSKVERWAEGCSNLTI